MSYEINRKKQFNTNSKVQQKACYLANKATEKFLEKASRETIRDLYESMVQIAEKNIIHFYKNEPPKKEVQCRAGCSHCCHMRVHVTPIEVLNLARHIKKIYSNAELEALILKLDFVVKRSQGLSDLEYGRRKIRCPLLKEDKCSVYKYRPFECRGYVSFDRQACIKAEQDYDSWNVPICYSQFSVFKGVQAGMSTTFAAKDYEFELLEFNQALKIVLETKEALHKWLDGEEIFSKARLSADDPDVTAMLPWTNSIEVE